MRTAGIDREHAGRRPVAALGQAAELVWRAADRAACAWLGLAMLLVIAGGLAAALGPLALARLVDSLAAGGHPHDAPALVAGYAIALLAQRLFEQGQAYAYGRGEQRLVRALSGQGFEHMLRLPLSFHLDARSGALAQVLAEGATGLRLLNYHAVMTIAPALVQLIVAGAVIASVFDPATGLVLVAALLAYAAVFARGVARQAAPARAMSGAQVEAGALVADGLMNVEAVKTFAAEARFAARYDTALAAREAHWAQFLRHRLHNGLSVAVVFALALGLTLLFAVRGVGQGEVTVGGLVLLNTYALQLVRPVELLGLAARDVGQGLAYLEQLLGVLARTPEASAGQAAPRPVPPAPAALAFEGVCFGFAPERPVLSEVSFQVASGAMVGVVGPSGSGKSSLLRLILRLHEPDSGRILLDGEPIRDMDLGVLRGQIAVVSQDTILFNETIGENIRLGSAAAEPGDLAAAAAAARLSDLLARLPDGLETPVGERGLKLSGGEKQRVSIARAALKHARLVLFDEATAALDTATERAVWQGMAELSKGATTLVVTHRLATVVGADEILVLDRGRIVERGDHVALLAADGAYARLWRAQASAARPLA